jgi:hypothetical protein
MHVALGWNAAPLIADTGLWVWGAIIVFWIAMSIVGAIRRGAKNLAQGVETEAQAVEQSPAAQRLGASARQMTDDAQADLGHSSSDLSTQSVSAGQVVDVGKQLLAQIQAARQAAATLTVSAARAAAPRSATTAAGQALTATLENVLDARAAQDPMSGLPLPVQHHRGLQGLPAFLHAPGGLAFAVLSATVIGPCTAQKSGPQEPGGW